MTDPTGNALRAAGWPNNTLGFCCCGRHRSQKCRTCTLAEQAKDEPTAFSGQNGTYSKESK